MLCTSNHQDCTWTTFALNNCYNGFNSGGQDGSILFTGCDTTGAHYVYWTGVEDCKGQGDSGTTDFSCSDAFRDQTVCVSSLDGASLTKSVDLSAFKIRAQSSKAAVEAM